MSAASCEEVTDLLEPFADGELALSDQEAVAQHVRGCTECQLHLEELRVFRGKLKRLPPFKAEAGLASRLAERLAEKREPARREAWSAWSMPVASHLAAALIGLAAGYWILLGAIQSDSLSRELVAAHVRSLMAAQPFDVASGDPHRVGPWFAGKLDFAPKGARPRRAGFPSGRRSGRLFRRPQGCAATATTSRAGAKANTTSRPCLNSIRDELDMLTKLLGA